MTRCQALAALSAVALAGCTVGPDYVRPQLPSSPAIAHGAFLRAGYATTSPAPARWWEGLGDSRLNQLIEAGLAGAPDLAAARARLEQARTQVRAARASALPVAGLSTAYAHADLPNGAFGSDSPSGGELFAAGFDARWEVDLWGGVRRSVEQRRAEADVTEAQLADAQVSLSAEIARTYVDFRAAEAREALLQEEKRLLDRRLDFVRQRSAAGTASRQDVEAALRALSANAAALVLAQNDATIASDALAVLTGTAPGTLALAGPAAVPLPPAELAIGDPAAMLSRRPDIRMAERRLAAATARIGVAEARRFPSLSLLGLIGIGGAQAGDLFDTAQVSTIALPQLSWHFLDFGRTAAARDGAKAGRDAALADYQASILRALQDAEAALSRFGSSRTAWLEAGNQARSSAETARLEELRAAGGTISRFDAMTARLQATNARIAAIDSAAAMSKSYVSLAKALGLGWSDPISAGAKR